MSATLTTHDTRFDDPDPATIAKILAELDGDRHVLATLGESDLTYLQVTGGGPMGLALEFQEELLFAQRVRLRRCDVTRDLLDILRRHLGLVRRVSAGFVVGLELGLVRGAVEHVGVVVEGRRYAFVVQIETAIGIGKHVAPGIVA